MENEVEKILTKIYNNNSNKNHSLTKHHHATKIPTKQQQQQLPLHSKQITTIDINKLKAQMPETHRGRFEKLLSMMFEPFSEKIEQQQQTKPQPSLLTEQQISQLIDNDIIHKVSDDDLKRRPSRSTGWAFTVVEEREEGERLRMIFWPREVNERLKYNSEMRLQHVSRYINAAACETAATADLAVAFFQIALPERARAFYRFVDSNNNTYEMTRMPMGLCVSAEIMQMATETIAGCLHATIPGRANLKTTNDVWIDGLRIAGSVTNVRSAINNINSIAKEIGAAFKAPPAIANKYNFIGVSFDHDAHSVRVAEKTRKKLPATFPDTTTASFLEQTVARMIFAAGVLHFPLAPHYFALKFAIRVCHKLRHDKVSSDTQVTIPAYCKQQLDKWLRSCHQTFRVAERSNTAPDILYSDASKHGWGAVLIQASGEVSITGEPWSRHVNLTNNNINELEAIAVARAFSAFENKLSSNKNVDFRIDNTSVERAVGRALARTFGINNFLAATLQTLGRDNYVYTTSFVKSADNLADAPSRGDLQPRDRGLNIINSSRGAVGRVAA